MCRPVTPDAVIQSSNNFLSLFDSAVDTHLTRAVGMHSHNGSVFMSAFGRPMNRPPSDNGSTSSGSARSSPETFRPQPTAGHKGKDNNKGAKGTRRAVVKGPWTAPEDERLIQLVKEFGPKKWKGQQFVRLLTFVFAPRLIRLFVLVFSHRFPSTQPHSKTVPRALVPPPLPGHQQGPMD